MEPHPLDADLLLRAYATGIFPMAESRDDPTLFWVDPKLRGVFELEKFHVSRSLARRILRGDFSVTTNQAFGAVVDGCADRDETWINAPIRALYMELHAHGHAHSVEAWDGPNLVGGVYGVTLGAAFFGESMFSKATDASKIALAYLVRRLTIGGFKLFDTQFLTPHLASLGAIEIPRAQYHDRLDKSLNNKADFLRATDPMDPYEVAQRSAQTSNRG